MSEGNSPGAAEIAVLTTGGTIDKVYFDASSEFSVGESVVEELLREAHVDVHYRLVEVMRKDSLDMSNDDRAAIGEAVAGCAERCIVITHGTDTMSVTAEALSPAGERTIVLTGALSPARFARSDATFNVGMAFAAAQTLPAGVYIVMNGQVFESGAVRKDTANNRFVRC